MCQSCRAMPRRYFFYIEGMMIKPYYERGNITIYNCDCREVLPKLPMVDLCLTDPPYGIGLGTKQRCKNMSKHGNDGYTIFEDNPEYISSVCVPTINLCRTKAKHTLLTPGIRNLFMYDNPDALWCLYWSAGAGIGKWKSFTCW